jgi:hypothetical protein
MPANFFTIAWSIVLAIIILAGFIVSLAGITMMVTAIARTLQSTTDKESQAQQGSDDVDDTVFSSRKSTRCSDSWAGRESGVMETVTMDSIHYIPTP